MTIEQRIARIPTDRHVYYETRWRGETYVYLARFWDEGHFRAVTLGHHLPAGLPDYPCQHYGGNGWSWPVPTNEAEHQEAVERGRRGNAMRRKHSNKWLKLQEEAS